MNDNNKIPTSMIQSYLSGLIDKLYKVLPMKENNDVTLNTYSESLLNELIGGIKIFTTFDSDTKAKYLTMLNVITFLNKNDFDNSTCKREIFKCIRLVRDIQYKIKQYSNKGV
jgi:hypothetical protein